MFRFSKGIFPRTVVFTFRLVFTDFILEQNHGITSSNLCIWLTFFYWIYMLYNISQWYCPAHRFSLRFQLESWSVALWLDILNPLGDTFVCVCVYICILSLMIGLCVYGLHVAHYASLEQVIFAIKFSFKHVYIKPY